MVQIRTSCTLCHMGIGKEQNYLLTTAHTLIALALVALASSACNSIGVEQGGSVKDSDWNMRFGSNCKLPHYDSIRWLEENGRRFTRFSLNDKDKGGCPTDKAARHSAPYWERAELRQTGFLKKNNTYTIDKTLRFVEGFNGEREAFFQVHAYNKSCKQAGPPLMLMFDNNKHTDSSVLTLHALQSSKRHNSYRSSLNIKDVLGEWIDLTLRVDTSDEGKITLSIDDEVLFTDVPFWIAPCGKPHIKFGAYRPGRLSGNDVSVVDFDSINVE